MFAQLLGRVDTSEDGRLSRCALRPARETEVSVGWDKFGQGCGEPTRGGNRFLPV